MSARVSLLGYALLGLLHQKPSSGYALRRVFATTPMGTFSDSPGAIYPALGRLERHLGLAMIMRVGLVIETLTHLVLALTTWAWLALVVFFVFGVHAFVWGTTSTSVRQRAVPTEMQGRVGSVYMLGVMGGMVAGAAIAGPLANRWGITAPFWFAFVGSAVILALIWNQLGHIAHADEETLAREPA